MVCIASAKAKLTFERLAEALTDAQTTRQQRQLLSFNRVSSNSSVKHIRK